MIPYFRSLGENLERAWLEVGNDEEAFPQLALAELARAPPVENVEVAEIIDWVFSPAQGLLQPSPQEIFGQPPVTVFRAPRFYIELLFWLAGTTGTHEHAFWGAFTVLAGSSVHSHWRFEPSRTINSRMRCGKMERLSTEILRTGDVQPIYPGDRLIHQLFHLDIPSVTIVVRTNADDRYRPQYEYHPPGLAVDNDDREGSRVRQMIFLDGMARGHFNDLEKYSRRLIESGDLETIYHTLSLLTRSRVDSELLEKLYGMVRRRHGEFADLLQQVCEEQRRIRLVTALRAKVLDPQGRFLLAVLMLMPDRDAIFETVRLQYPDVEPFSAFESLLEHISSPKAIGFDLDAGANRLLFRGLMKGLGIEEMLQTLRSEFSDDSLAANRQKLLDHATEMAQSNLFRPLFSNSPFQQGAALLEQAELAVSGA